MKPKRVNKSKERILSEIQLKQDADRRRSVVKEIVFPFLLEMNDSISYSKIFLQSFSGIIEGIYEDKRKITTIGDLKTDFEKKLESVFNPEMKSEKDKYLKLSSLLDGVSIQDLSYALELPRYLDGFMMNEKGKESISTVDIQKIMG